MQQGQQIYLPPLTFVNRYLIIATVVVFVVDALVLKSAGFSLVSIFGLIPAKILSGHIHEFFLYPLYNNSLMGVAFNSLLLWFIGSELEEMWGMKKYLLFIFISYFGAGIVYFIFGATLFASSPAAMVPFAGLHGICSSLCMAYAVLFPNRIFHFMMIFPLKSKYFCMILIAMELYMGLMAGALQSWGHLAAMFFAFGFMWSLTRPAVKKLMEQLDKPSERSKVPKNSHLRIVKNDDDEGKPPKYWQ